MIGQTILHYRIVEKLGEGGMGVVYKAHDTRLDRTVALKFLPPSLAPSEADRTRFIQEARAASALNHPNVCTVHDIQEHDGHVFIVMEFVEGQTLHRRIATGSLDVETALSYAMQIGEALKEAHAKEIVHRDVKSENIMVNTREQIKVMDFGLAKLKGSLKLTQATSTIGTLAYMAPEQINGGNVDARSDIFSFGVVLYEMLAGRTPFRGDHAAALMYSILNESPDPLQRYRSDVPAAITHVIHRALEKDPADRYQTIAEMIIELRRAKKDSTKVPLQQPAQALPPAARRRTRRGLLIGGSAAGLLIIVFLSYWLFLRPASQIDSIAILPLVNDSQDQELEYLSEGITENIINTLSQIPRIRVVPRNSAFRYKGKDVDASEVGKELNVRAILTGRMNRRVGTLSISVELTDSKDNRQIWGQHYVRNASDILALQDAIAREVSERLRLQLSGEDERRLTKRYTNDAEAYELYLKGRYLWNKRNGPDIKRAIEYFNQAIEKDPGFALAFIGLATSYAILPEYGGLSATEMYAKAEVAAQKAMELDPGLSETHMINAFLKEVVQFDFEGAEIRYRNAIDIDPNNVTAHHWYSLMLRKDLGRYDEGLTEIKKARDLDPLSQVVAVTMADCYFYMKNYDEAKRELRKIIDLDPQFALAHNRLGYVYLSAGERENGLQEFETVRKIVGKGPYGLGGLGYAHALNGEAAKARAAIATLKEFRSQGYSLDYHIALVHFGLREFDTSLAWLDSAATNRSNGIEDLSHDPTWDAFRTDPRFEAVLRKHGLKK